MVGLQAYSDKVNRNDTIVTFLSKLIFFFSKVDIYIYILVTLDKHEFFE